MNKAVMLNDELDTFVIDTPGKADWAIKKIKEERALCDIYITAARQNIDLLNQQIKSREEYLQNSTSNLILQLSEWFESQPGKVAKTQKSLVLPNGKLVKKFAKSEYQRDEAKLLDVLAGTQYIQEVPKLKWAELKNDIQIIDGSAVLSTTGEVLDGVTVIEKPETFAVE
jgi:Ni,Fe-hydrogenase I large subunit